MHYLNYKKLKKIIQSLSTFSVQDPLTGSNTLAEADLARIKGEFFAQLQTECDGINAYYEAKEASFKQRLSLLLQSRETGREPATLVKMKGAIERFQHDLALLQTFVELNSIVRRTFTLH